ncbi:MAG TPA: hypothetical protein VJO34_05020 [Methylomirabilota bacterium]|nr:hypothetical protein [Methylomirabilota bacterium]
MSKPVASLSLDLHNKWSSWRRLNGIQPSLLLQPADFIDRAGAPDCSFTPVINVPQEEILATKKSNPGRINGAPFKYESIE